MIKIGITKEEHLEAKEISQERNIPYVDSLNAIQARNHKAMMVSQDKHFFKNTLDIVKAVRPEEIN